MARKLRNVSMLFDSGGRLSPLSPEGHPYSPRRNQLLNCLLPRFLGMAGARIFTVFKHASLELGNERLGLVLSDAWVLGQTMARRTCHNAVPFACLLLFTVGYGNCKLVLWDTEIVRDTISPPQTPETLPGWQGDTV
jgi:hypothetical protein